MQALNMHPGMVRASNQDCSCKHAVGQLLDSFTIQVHQQQAFPNHLLLPLQVPLFVGKPGLRQGQHIGMQEAAAAPCAVLSGTPRYLQLR